MFVRHSVGANHSGTFALQLRHGIVTEPAGQITLLGGNLEVQIHRRVIPNAVLGFFQGSAAVVLSPLTRCK